MIQKIIKRESDYDVIVDNEIHNYDIHEIIGYSDNEIIGYTIEGVLIRVDTTTSDEVCYEPFKNECKTFELTLCNERYIFRTIPIHHFR